MRRGRQVTALCRDYGVRGLSEHALGALARRIAPAQEWPPVRTADLLSADLSRPFRPPSLPLQAPDDPLVINWVCTPPGPGAGGHSTLFRIVNHLAERGHRNRVYLYDVYCGDLDYQADIVRRHFGFGGPVARVEDGLEDAHAVVASAWSTAYPVFNARCAGKRFYFVQDFEPSFYPVGSFSVLAENTYRMGFHGITAGSWLAAKLKAEYGMDTDPFEFGCDVERYRRDPAVPRRGVAFYARPEVGRRAFEIGLLALKLLAARRSDVEIHLYGGKCDAAGLDCFNHGRLSPPELNALYNRCFAGLSLSMTNVSLVPHEMLAAGCIPVVNDAPQNRLVLANPHVEYAALAPHALADRLEAVVDAADFGERSRAAAASVGSTRWEQAGAAVESVLRRETLRARQAVSQEKRPQNALASAA